MCVVTEKHGRDATATSKGPAGLNIIVWTCIQTFMVFASVNHLYSSKGELDNQVNCPIRILLKAECHTCKIGLCSTRIRLPDCQPGCITESSCCGRRTTSCSCGGCLGVLGGSNGRIDLLSVLVAGTWRWRTVPAPLTGAHTDN